MYIQYVLKEEQRVIVFIVLSFRHKYVRLHCRVQRAGADTHNVDNTVLQTDISELVCFMCCNISEYSICKGTAVALVNVLFYKSEGRCLIPSGVISFFIDIKSFRSHYGPGVDSASNRNEYQEYFLSVKAVGA